MPLTRAVDDPESLAWRKDRNRALDAAGWKCGDCDQKDDLIVMESRHVTCKTCVADMSALIAREARIGGHTNLSDLTESVKTTCAQRGIPYAHGQVPYAMNRIESRLQLASPAVTRAVPEPDHRIGRAETKRILQRMGFAHE